MLYSSAYEKIYVGYTSNIKQRMLSHNKLGKKGWTIRYRPWELILSEVFETKKEAMEREKQLKTARGRKWIWELIRKKNNQ